MIRKSFDPVRRTCHRSSCDVEGEFRLVRDLSGNVSYVRIGERSISEYVSSFEKGCSLQSILERCSLMPVRDKVTMVNQQEQGSSVDLSAMPSDLTEAYIQAGKLAVENPELAKRVKAGEPLSAIISDVVKKDVKMEVISNGENESSND